MLYLLPAAYAASKVGPHYGFLAGCATMAAVLAAQTALLTWSVGWLERRRGGGVRPESAAPAAPGDDAKAEPDDESADEPVDEPAVPLQYGEHARFKQLVLVDDAARPGVTRRFYDRLKGKVEAFVAVESGRDGSDAAMVSAAELAASGHMLATSADDTLTVFASNDGAWSGFRVGDDWFRFRRGAITKFQLDLVMPVRWAGGYMVSLTFDVPERGKADDCVSHWTSLNLDLEHARRRSRTLTRACREIASLLDAAFDVSESSDD
ncbi:MAG: hypothetical protein IOC29_00120 [Burkholderia sp.]|uniref:hypothetical protein n=1 Tax=Burkholderia arboris TaxID=488730 RepID=UPI001CA3BB14|nr:hypothetical protein [Burkholderia arboris]MCA3827716.1 hypothetical protein [Burkholderia sp.]MCA3827854.1 hypothetical protein [Burkholderia sp.]MCA3836654.1 hypothetical protein [Burkholderia sp.]MCA3920532.1 hypothetical protein [Burkholderia sp.]